uniref:Uncharacterized protein n=1 Tax=Alexandrium andersonii TaxID=327968 RepID=A0A6U6IZQ1_9DINO|mmetsp:Transcript_13025/g.29532  ORF Transcript_13025/g.29532 Transcript_13025/m.29532 type:complete len:181 (+) Transcript_13025:61-603(+)
MAALNLALGLLAALAAQTAAVGDGSSLVQMDVGWSMMPFAGMKASSSSSSSLKAAILFDEEDLCWETSQKNLGPKVMALKMSPISDKFVREPVALNSTCAEQGFPTLVTQLDPCYKDSSVFKKDTSQVKKKTPGYQAAQFYELNVKEKRYWIHKHCFPKNVNNVEKYVNTKLDRYYKMLG